jgi:hypothetical protein
VNWIAFIAEYGIVAFLAGIGVILSLVYLFAWRVNRGGPPLWEPIETESTVVVATCPSCGVTGECVRESSEGSSLALLTCLSWGCDHQWYVRHESP